MIIDQPKFKNTIFQKECKNPSGSHHDNEAIYVLSNIDSSTIGIISPGHKAISFAKIIKNCHVFLPKITPSFIIEKLSTLTLPKYIHIIGNDYPSCHSIATEYMIRNDIVNISEFDFSCANIQTANNILTRIIPDYIFIPSTNLDLAIGIAEEFTKRKHNSSIIACILPDHPKSPRFNHSYNRSPYLTTIAYTGFEIPELNTKYKYLPNITLKTVKNPEYCYQKYQPLYPQLDPLNYITMQISELFPEDGRKVIVLTGLNHEIKTENLNTINTL